MRGAHHPWQWASTAAFIRWFTDSERRYAKALGEIVNVRLNPKELPADYRRRKVRREGLEVAIKIRGSQGRKRVEWVKPEHPYTAISDKSEVHANHVEAHNAALRRHCSTYRRHQNLYAKTTYGLRRAVTVQQLIHNWVRPHWKLGKGTTPAMAIGFVNRAITMEEMLTCRGLKDFIS